MIATPPSATAKRQLKVASARWPRGSHVFYCQKQLCCRDYCAGRNRFRTFSCTLKLSCQCAVNIWNPCILFWTIFNCRKFTIKSCQFASTLKGATLTRGVVPQDSTVSLHFIVKMKCRYYFALTSRLNQLCLSINHEFTTVMSLWLQEHLLPTSFFFFLVQ